MRRAFKWCNPYSGGGPGNLPSAWVTSTLLEAAVNEYVWSKVHIRTLPRRPGLGNRVTLSCPAHHAVALRKFRRTVLDTSTLVWAVTNVHVLPSIPLAASSGIRHTVSPRVYPIKQQTPNG